MKIYIVKDGNENENTMFFGNKKEALKYYNFLQYESKLEGEIDLDISCIDFKTINVEPNKKGILYAMRMACTSVGASCGDTESQLSSKYY
jgi:hypothetical protein